MSIEKQRQLVESLEAKTNLGLVDWKRHIGSPGEYEVSLGDNKVRISTEEDFGGNNEVRISLIANTGNVIFSFTDSDIDITFNNKLTYYPRMLNIMSGAAAKASGATDVMDSMLEKLLEL